MKKNNQKAERRNKIRRRIRSSIRGTAERPRLSIFKSSKHVYLQLINDLENLTVTSVSTKSPSILKEIDGKSTVDAANIVGKEIAKVAVDQGINKVVFDRSGYKYHGIVKSAAEGAREGGLDF